MTRRGFTLTELAICISLVALLSPLVYAVGRQWQDPIALGQWHLQSAAGLRTTAEALRADARSGPLLPGEAVAFALPGCTATYRIDTQGALRREGCGRDEALAQGVESLQRAPGGLSLTFVYRLRPQRPQRSTVFVPVVPR